MSQRWSSFSRNHLLSLMVVLVVPGFSLAQSVAATNESSPRPIILTSPENAGATVDARLKALEEELKLQNKSLVEMRTIIAEQQRVIATLS
ncbi:MAG: hypothetical protein ACMG6H_10600, partial [Acidobacteriota bacterium]